ncbi:MAG TPA: cytochrome ubiquinol oxidase subunit I [Alphaproteobacteria bacterium]|nr:cytochrome ubiquinol oxidase subunit I [Alphaproteobacteria bacterium]
MELDPVLLSRLQFAFTISFHILFPAFTIGLASWIAVLEVLWLATGRPLYLSISEFWTRIFAVSFAMGVVSGIVMSYQFGTNWSEFSIVGANVLGPLISYEVVTAFFLEATFLGILLFGRRRVPPRMHVLSAVLVALGTLASAFWILAANSWMQTPAGYTMGDDGRFAPLDWWAIVFNPSFPYRFAHMVVACYLTTAFVVAGASAWHLLKGRYLAQSRLSLSMALGLASLLAPLQILIGDLHGINTLEHQPVKVAAMEGHWETARGAPAILFALPDPTVEENHFELGVPKLGSLILTHDWEGEVRGLKSWPPEERPNVPIVFFAFRLMVLIGMAMLAIALTSLALRWRRRLYDSDWFLRLTIAATPIGFIAILAGWTVTEVGRQPWVVFGLVRTVDAISPNLTGATVAFSLAVFILAYAVIFGAGLYYMLRLIRIGPQPVEELGTPKRPLSAAEAAR